MRIGVRRCVPFSPPHESGDIGRSLADRVDTAKLEVALPFRTAGLTFPTAPLADGEFLIAAASRGYLAPQIPVRFAKEFVNAAG